MQWFYELHPTMQAFFASLFTYFLTVLGAACVFFSKKFSQSFLNVLMATAGGIMIAASFFSLLLPAIEYPTAIPSWLVVTFAFFLGGLFIILSDFSLSRTSLSQKGSRQKNTLLYFAVTLHNIPEGMAVGVAFAQGGTQAAILAALLFAVGIGLQNFPEGMCIAFPLRASGVSAGKSFLFAQGSGAVEVPSAVLGAFAAGAIVGIMPWALAFSAGAMIAVVCSELIPECFSENKLLASFGIIFGFCVMMILDLALG